MLFKSLLSVALFAASAFGIQFTSFPTTVEAGKTYTITWTGGDSTPATIVLRKGNPGNLGTVATITTSGSGGSYSWTAPSNIAPGSDYAFQIIQGSADNYSGQFSYSGGTGAAVSPTGATGGSSAALPTITGGSSRPASVTTGTTLSTSAVSSASNGTTTRSSSATSGSSSTSRATSASPSQTTGPANNMASGFQSPLALILGVVAAMVYFQ